MSFIGDTHPVFHGSVVKAIASAKRSYPAIMRALSSSAASPDDYSSFEKTLVALFDTKVVAIEAPNDEWSLLTVHAPAAAKRHAPGQFYRIQNYENGSEKINGTTLQTEAIAALGIKNDDAPDQLQFLIKKAGVSSAVLHQLQSGDPVAVMGPTGVKSPIPEGGETFYIVGDQMAIAYLLAVGPPLKSAGCKIVFICQLTVNQQPFFESRIEQIADHVVWSTDSDDVVQTMANERVIGLERADHLVVIGPVALQKKIQMARSDALSAILKPTIKCIASVYGPMQCMLKGVCAQCLQWQVDPKTGERTKAVYACSWQHQPMEIIDMNNVDERLGQNKMQEKLTNLWLSYLVNK